MNISDFKKLVETYGAHSDRWPAEIRHAASEFMAENEAETAAIVADEMALDAALDLATEPPISDLTRQRILNAVATPDPSVNAPKRHNANRWQAIAATFVGAFALGFGGAQIAPLGTASTDSEQVAENVTNAQWQEAATDLGMSDIYEWASGGEVQQ